MTDLALSEAALSLIPDREWSRHPITTAPPGPPHYSVLDHGYVKVIRSWGSDEEIIETARMSTDKGFLGWEPGACPVCNGSGWTGDAPRGDLEMQRCHACEGRGVIPGDAKLLRHLYEHRHSTPFEFGGLTLEVQAPLMVFREWHRHRTQSYSEMSARYVQMPDLHYVPSVERIIASARKQRNKQASGGGALHIPDSSIPPLVPPEVIGMFRRQVQSEEDTARFIQQLIRGEQKRVYDLYEQLLSFGVAKEIARIDTPVSRYSRMRATTDLRNWLAFLTLRMDPNAQFEIRQYAWCVADAIAVHFPRTYELFLEGMTPTLEPELAPKKLLSDSLEALSWASGATDFNEGGIAAEGWRNIAAPLITRLCRSLGRSV